MWKVALPVLAVWLLLASPVTAGEHGSTYTRPHLGLSVNYPVGWRPIHHQLTPCSNPVERIDVQGPGRALVMLQEVLGRDATKGLPARPARFGVSGSPSPLECCSVSTRPGWVVPFKDGGRGFYAYLYPGREDRRTELLAILNSLRVRPARPAVR